MAVADWTFIVTDLTGVQVGEVIDATERSVTRALNGPSTASFRVRADNNLMPTIMGNNDLLIRAYRNKQLMFHGPVVSIEFSSDDPTNIPTIAVGATDCTFRLTKRIAGKSGTGTLFTNKDRLTIAETLITSANSEGETGVNVLGHTDLTGTTWIAGPYRVLSECVQELCQTLDGFDWRMDPTEYAAGKINNFKAAPSLGSSRAGVVFEYQGRGNARLPNFQRDWSTLGNKAYHVAAEGAASVPYPPVNASDATSIAARGLYEVLADADLTNLTLRNTLLADTVAIRKDPRQVFSFSPDLDDGSGRTPTYGSDYEIGDTVRGRVIYEGVTLIDGMVRLYKMQFDIDTNNRETLTPTMVDES